MKERIFGVITSHISPDFLTDSTCVSQETPFGTAQFYTGTVEGVKTVVCLRYGDQVAVASHNINARANMWGMKLLGVTHIISQNAIGSCNETMRPGHFVIPDDAMDFTKQRVRSFFDEENCWVRVDMTQPFCPSLRTLLLNAIRTQPVTSHDGGVFIATEGPRFETAAEVRFYRNAGADIIGTPLFPELVLAKEAGMCYASLAMIINMCTGLGAEIYQSGDDGLLSVYEKTNMEQVTESVLRAVAMELHTANGCACPEKIARGFFGEKPSWM